MTKVQIAADAVLDVTLRLFRNEPRSASVRAFDSMVEMLSEELGIPRASADREVRAAIVRRAAKIKSQGPRAIAAGERNA